MRFHHQDGHCFIRANIRANIRALLLLAAAALSTATAAAESTLEESVLATSHKLFAASGATGMILTVVRGDALLFVGEGETEKGGGQKPAANTLLRVGSMSKVLATSLLIKLTEEGVLHLSDPLQKFAPAGMAVPQFKDGAPITLLHLATHTSGLARYVDGAAPAHSAPFTWPDHAARWNWLVKQRPSAAPGQAALYSNPAYDLLADAIAVAAKQAYDQLLHDKVTALLGMMDTTATPGAEQCSRLMGARSIADVGACADTRATAGNGGMYSTAADMGRWMQSLLGVSQASSDAQRALSQAVYVQRQTLTSVTGLDKAGLASGIGLGWIYLAPGAQTPAILQKTGGGGGFSSYMALLPGRQLGIFVALTQMNMDNFTDMAMAVNDLAVQLDGQGLAAGK